MKKILQTFIIWFLIAFLAIASTPLVLSQKTPPPQAASQIEGFPVVFNGENLFVVKNNFGALSARGRQQRTQRQIAAFADDYTLSLTDLEANSIDAEGIPISTIQAGSIVIAFVTERDAKVAQKKRQELANEYVQIIRPAVQKYREERSFEQVIRGIIFSVIATIFLIFILKITKKLFARFYQWLLAWEETHIRPVRLGDFELIGANQLDNVITFITKTIQVAIILGLLVGYLTFVLKQFPWSRGFTLTFWGSFLKVLQSGWASFINYLPSLLTISMIIAFSYSVIYLSKRFFQEVDQGTITIAGFYPDWAWPTFGLMRILVIAMTCIAIFPLLPGFKSPAFQGVSVFLGLLISLGSTSVISNIVSGSVLIYTRSFRIGDCIKVGQVFGQVIEKTLLVTRLLTPQNVVISIPNSQIINNYIENSNFAQQELNKPLIEKTKVYLGYEVSWRQAYEALIEAALRTEGVSKSPSPLVLQGELNPVYVTYLLNVYLDTQFFEGKTAKAFEITISQLHENIQDCCAEAGIRIFAPSYEIADPTHYGPAASN